MTFNTRYEQYACEELSSENYSTHELSHYMYLIVAHKLMIHVQFVYSHDSINFQATFTQH